MFTGLVEGMGEVLQATAEGPGLLLRVRTPFSPPVAELGASIAINGVCLTAIQIEAGEVGPILARYVRNALANMAIGATGIVRHAPGQAAGAGAHLKHRVLGSQFP